MTLEGELKMKLAINGQPTGLTIPDDYVEVAHDRRIRNGEPVRVERLQSQSKITPENEHLTLVWGSDERLISYNLSAGDAAGVLPSGTEARRIAQNIFAQIDPEYELGLDFMRVDRQVRSYRKNNQTIQIPIQWVKFGHRNGTYNWVSVGPDGRIIELERESEWDYLGGRRATEMWNYDDWVLAREGQGPQIAAPNALA